MAHDLEYADAIHETLDQLEREDAECVIKKRDDSLECPEHFLDRLKKYPVYKFRVGDYPVTIDWDTDEETLYAIDAL